MTQLFLNLLNMSIAAGWIVLAVLLLRPFINKLPKWISCLLWGIAGLRLVLPFFPQSVISLLPSDQTVPLDLAVTTTPAVHSGVSSVNTAVNTVLAQRVLDNTLTGILDVAWVIWVVGMSVLLLYGSITSLRLHMQVRVSLHLEGNVYICDHIQSPFIYGMIRPRIYLPSGMDLQQQEHVLAHERAHLHRFDHLWKPMGFMLLAVYWFHPLLWVGYFLLCKDIEQACDEKVISKKDGAWRKSYSETLASCSAHRRLVMFCPVAFGEVGIKDRIKGILYYKKPALWIMVLAILCCSVLAAGFLTNPPPCEHSYESAVTREPTCTQDGERTFTCTQCQNWYTEPIAMLPHNYDDAEVIQPATCTAEGILQYTCISCEFVQKDTIVILPHTVGETFVSREPNCISHGTLSAHCTVCSLVFPVEQLSPNGVHDLLETVMFEATCTEEGHGIIVCTRCNYSEKQVYPKKAHNFVGGHISRSPGILGCEGEGLQVFCCTDCNAQYTKVHTSLGHDFATRGDGCRVCQRCGWNSGRPNNDPLGITSGNFIGGSPPSLPVIIWDLNHVIKPGG